MLDLVNVAIGTLILICGATARCEQWAEQQASEHDSIECVKAILHAFSMLSHSSPSNGKTCNGKKLLLSSTIEGFSQGRLKEG
jgi:hypothetical protein